MNPVIIVAIVIAVLVVAAIVVTLARRRRSERLQHQFGPEYEHQVEEAKGDRGKAESALLKREKRVEKLHIHPLPPAQRDAFAHEWRQVQARFVDDPERTIALADALVAEVMKARGYPIADFEQRAADISVEHPRLVENYRKAHDVAMRHSRGEAGTEDLRTAFLNYRALFEELLRAEAPELAH